MPAFFTALAEQNAKIMTSYWDGLIHLSPWEDR
jgi:hypothetical protein